MPVNPRKNRESSELPEEFVNHSPAARGLPILLVFYQHPKWFISLQPIETCGLLPGAVIGDGDRKCWDPRGPMTWDNFSIFRTNCAILTSYIHARVVVSRVDAVTLRDQLLRIARFSCGFFTAMVGNKEPELFHVLLCS